MHEQSRNEEVLEKNYLQGLLLMLLLNNWKKKRSLFYLKTHYVPSS